MPGQKANLAGLPRVSVVIPTYNRSRLLGRAVQSVLSQTFEDWELLVADDASPDDTADQMATFEDRRLRYLRRETNGGNAAARNLGIRSATGEVIAFLDDDDEYHPQFLERMVELLAQSGPEVGFGWCGAELVDDTDPRATPRRARTWSPRFGSRHEAYLGFLRSRKIGTGCGLVVKRKAFERSGLLDESLRAAVDTELLVRLARDFDFAVLAEPLVVIHHHDGARVRHDAIARVQTYRRLVEQHRPALEQHRGTRASLEYKLGWLCFHAGQRGEGRRHMWAATRLAPRNLKRLAVWLMLELLGPYGPVLHRRLSKSRLSSLLL